MSRPRLAVVGGAIVAMLAPGAARAATLERSPFTNTFGQLTLQAAPGERNDTTVTAQPDGTVTIEEAGAPLDVKASGCVAEGKRARCRPFKRGEIAYVNLYLGDQNDRGVCVGPIACGLNGEGGDDVLIGGPGADEIDGGPGNDVLEGGAGNDFLDGDATGNAATQSPGAAGNDVLRAGPGDDFLQGGPGEDQLAGESGNDIMDGGTGGDVISGGPGVDHLAYNLQSAGAPRQAPELQITFDALPDDGPPGERDNVAADVERAYSLTGAVLSPLPGAPPIVEPLTDALGRPLDTRVGVRIYRLTASGTAGAQSGLFRGTPFRVRDSGRNDKPTELRLTGSSLLSCASTARTASSGRRRLRHLLVNAHGLFRVDGNHVALTIQGTAYELIESCRVSIVHVLRGVVIVEHAGRIERVRAGHRVVVRTRR